jgi:hypothetical protein
VVDFGIEGPYHDHHSAIEQTDRDEARLGIHKALVFEGEPHAREHFRRVEEIEAALPQRVGPFLRIESDLNATRKLCSYDDKHCQGFS